MNTDTQQNYTCRRAARCKQAGKYTACTYSDGSRCEVDDAIEINLRKWVVRCAASGAQLVVRAETYKEANDLIIDAGWSHDNLFGGLVCPEAMCLNS